MSEKEDCFRSLLDEIDRVLECIQNLSPSVYNAIGFETEKLHKLRFRVWNQSRGRCSSAVEALELEFHEIIDGHNTLREVFSARLNRLLVQQARIGVEALLKKGAAHSLTEQEQARITKLNGHILMLNHEYQTFQSQFGAIEDD